MRLVSVSKILLIYFKYFFQKSHFINFKHKSELKIANKTSFLILIIEINQISNKKK